MLNYTELKKAKKLRKFFIERRKDWSNLKADNSIKKRQRLKNMLECEKSIVILDKVIDKNKDVRKRKRCHGKKN
jgi:hypothetical protein